MQYLVGRNPVMEALEMDMGVTNLYIQKQKCQVLVIQALMK